jgi:hypothetical protein
MQRPEGWRTSQNPSVNLLIKCTQTCRFLWASSPKTYRFGELSHRGGCLIQINSINKDQNWNQRGCIKIKVKFHPYLLQFPPKINLNPKFLILL